MGRTPVGEVILVGAGPGDAGLLTLRGRELLRHADVVVYDRLVGREVLAFIRKGARRIAAESLGSHGEGRQEGINRVLVAEALRGRRVVRLKGGDPFVFGRGWEEAEFLESHRVPWQVVPGVTSVFAGPALADIPVTHRRSASVVTVATGHEALGKESVPWERIARVGGTLVVLMCSDRIGGLARRLQRGGLPASMPVAVVSRASWPDQDVRRAALGTIASVLRTDPIPTPALLVVGDVAALGEPRARPAPRRIRRTGRLPR